MKASPLSHATRRPAHRSFSPLPPSAQQQQPAAEPAPAWLQGRVIASGDNNWLVQDAHGTRRMRRALSCLLLPEVGDVVAGLPAAEPGGGWIVAVLERNPAPDQAPAPQRLRVDGDLSLEVQGQWRTQAASAQLQAESVSVQAQTLSTRFDVHRSLGRLVEATVSCTRWVGQELTAVVDRWSQHSQSSSRQVEGMDRAEAGHMELRAKGVLHAHGQHVLTEGENLVKTRGGQIHFGG